MKRKYTVAVICLIVVLFVAFFAVKYMNKTKTLQQAQTSPITSNEEEKKMEITEIPVETRKPKKKKAKVTEIPEATLKAPENVYKTIDELHPGDVVTREKLAEDISLYFKSYEIVEDDEIYNRIINRSYRENDNISLSDLRYIKMPHYNFAHQIQIGEMILNVAIADDVLNIFQELFAADYEIQSMNLIDNYWSGDGDSSDSASIDANNTSCFCYREVTGGSNLSNHAYGCAIDINPQQNPYIWDNGSGWQWTHENASAYVDRSCGDPHVVVKGDVCYNIFTKYGFSWGGEWQNPIDYQHFEKKVN